MSRKPDYMLGAWMGHMRHLEVGYWYEKTCRVCQLECIKTSPDAKSPMADSLNAYAEAKKSGVSRISYRAKKSKAAGA